MKHTSINRLKRLAFASTVLMAVQPAIQAQSWETWTFRERGYYDPLVAEPRAATMKFLFPGYSDEFPFSFRPGRHVGWDISVGKELPIFGMSTNPVDPLPSGTFGWGLWVPVSFHMAEDLTKDPSAPILNTDYRFGVMLKAQIGLPEKGTMTGSHLGFRFVPWAHESTHIGDEFTLSALDAHGDEFKRVNVSYEYWELGVSFEPNFGRDGLDHLKFRFAYLRLWDQAKGWYDRELFQPRGGIIPASTRNFEPSWSFEYFAEPDQLSNRRLSPFKGYGVFTAIDLRDRTVYYYGDEPSPDPNRHKLSINLLVGWRRKPGVDPLGKLLPEFYFRYYHGVNPNGQFRSQPDYDLVGFGFRFGI